eukprot:TRINITY_DN35164_c1_g1_i2.p1 TRINITY_DN35164_c1_g1~~TRINITY_DN35164_c1_g1_i2.p1  ORF type:complete len:144 (-),score=15.95 TRINITY_DN35164_c1_g1_i2:8-439(-)
MHPRLQVLFTCSFTLEVPVLERQEEFAVRIVERELLERWQRKASIDNTVIVTQYFELSRIDHSLREVPTFHMNVDDGAHGAVVLDFHRKLRWLSKSHLNLLHRRSFGVASRTAPLLLLHLIEISLSISLLTRPLSKPNVAPGT